MQAYKALTDETSRANYQKYGHPDGPQAMTGARWGLGGLEESRGRQPARPGGAAEHCSVATGRLLPSPSRPLATSLPAVSVALPAWLFSKDKKNGPVILLTLLLGGIVTPLGIAAWYLTRTQK